MSVVIYWPLKVVAKKKRERRVMRKRKERGAGEGECSKTPRT